MSAPQATKLNEMQQFMIRQFDRPLSPGQQVEVKQLLSDYFAKLIDDQIDQIWDERGITQQNLNDALETHYRTPYQR
jgi:hypothetical protein